MGDRARAKWAEKCGAAVPLSVAWAEAYLRTKWHPDPSNRLATIHQRYRQSRQTGQTTVR